MEGSDWREMIEACRSSGMTAKAWCEENGVNYHSYCCNATRYNREEKEKGLPGPHWAVVKPIKDPELHENIKLTCGKWTIIVQKGFDPDLFSQVLMAVSSTC